MFGTLLGFVVLIAIYWLRLDDPTINHEIKVISNNKVVEEYLGRYKEVIGEDYEGYRNHIYRVLTYSMHYMGDKQEALPLVAIALVYHDIGLWTAGRLNYLEPGIDLLTKECTPKYSPLEVELMNDIIDFHHKVTPYVGNNADIINAVRKADWIDATLTIVNHGMSQENTKLVRNALPNAGFHKTLANFGPKLHGFDVVRIVKDLSKIMKL